MVSIDGCLAGQNWVIFERQSFSDGDSDHDYRIMQA